jgi:acetoin utilization protein AcuB
MAFTVREIMATKLLTVGPQDSTRRAYQLMRDHRIRHLPVLSGGRLVGILSDRDLRLTLVSPGLAETRVGEVMTDQVTTIAPDTSVEDAASLLVVKKIGCLPVVEQDRLVGIVTETDLLAVLVELLGLLTQSTRLDIQVDGGLDAYERMVGVIRDHAARILSVGAVPERDGGTIFSVRLEPCDARPLVRALGQAGFRVLTPSASPSAGAP